MAGHAKVFGDMDIIQDDDGIRWRYKQAKSLLLGNESLSDPIKSYGAFKSMAKLFSTNLDGVRVHV